MKPESKWTKNEREFDRIMSLMESRVQIERIQGRLAYTKFSDRFTSEQLDKMAESIGAKKTK